MYAYLFLDLETTGKDSWQDQIWSASWMIDVCDDLGVLTNRCSRDLLIQHTKAPTPWVLANTDYLKHFQMPAELHLNRYEAPSVKSHLYDPDVQIGPKETMSNNERIITPRKFLTKLMIDTQGYHCPVYAVGAQIGSFDFVFLKRLQATFYPGSDDIVSYRFIEVESLAMGWASAPKDYYEDAVKSMQTAPVGLGKAWSTITGKKIDRNYEHNSHNDMMMTRELFYKILGIDPPILALS